MPFAQYCFLMISSCRQGDWLMFRKVWLITARVKHTHFPTVWFNAAPLQAGMFFTVVFSSWETWGVRNLIGIATGFGIGRRCGLDPGLSWLWLRLAAVAPVWPLGTSTCHRCGQKKKKKINFWYFLSLFLLSWKKKKRQNLISFSFSRSKISFQCLSVS